MNNTARVITRVTMERMSGHLTSHEFPPYDPKPSLSHPTPSTTGVALTPCRQHSLERVAGDVGAEDLDEGQVLQHRLDQHPGERDEDQVVEQDGHQQTHWPDRRLLHPEQEHQLEADESDGHVEQGLLGATLAKFSVERKGDKR